MYILFFTWDYFIIMLCECGKKVSQSIYCVRLEKNNWLVLNMQSEEIIKRVKENEHATVEQNNTKVK